MPSPPSDVMAKTRECPQCCPLLFRKDTGNSVLLANTCLSCDSAQHHPWTTSIGQFNKYRTSRAPMWNRRRNKLVHEDDYSIVHKSFLSYPSPFRHEKELTALCSRVLDLLKCPVCFEPVYPPILQCANGHVFCSRCSPSLQDRCPLCRIALNPPIRNRCLEAVLASFSFPCRFQCRAFIPFDKMLDHEHSCLLRELPCPCAGCVWTGRDVELVEHLLGGHPRILNLHGNQIVFLATEIDVPGKRLNWIMIQHCFKRHFLLLLERCHRDLIEASDCRLSSTGRNALASDGEGEAGECPPADDALDSEYMYWATVQLISSDTSESDQFQYRMELEDNNSRVLNSRSCKDTSGKNISWESPIKCIGRTRKEILQDDECLMFSGSLASSYMRSMKLPLNVTISRRH